MVSSPLINDGMESCALHFTGCRGCDRLRDRRRFLRRGPDNLVDGFSGAERRRTLNIGAWW